MRTIFILCLLSLGAATAEEIEVLDLRSLGIPSPSDRVEARRISDLFLHKGRLYIGTGDAMVNTGPTPVLAMDAMDTDTRKVTTEFTVDDEAILRYRLLDGTLAIPGVDATESWEFGNVYVRGEAGWTKHRTLPLAVHVNDLAVFEGAWFATTGTVYEIGKGNRFGAGSILVSPDRGATWFPEYVTGASPITTRRIDALAPFRGKLYAFGYAYAGFPEKVVPEDVRASAGPPITHQGNRYYTLYVPDAQGPAETYLRAGAGWMPIDLLPAKNVCRIRPVVFGDRLLLFATTGSQVAPFAGYWIDGPVPVPGATFTLYSFDGERAEPVEFACDGVLDVLARDGRLYLLVLKGGHYWIAQTKDLNAWRWFALPLDRGRPLCLEVDGPRHLIGTRDGNLFRSEGFFTRVSSPEEIGGQDVSGFELTGDLPRDFHGYWAAITRFRKPGLVARGRFEVWGVGELKIGTENVAAMRIFLPSDAVLDGKVTVVIDDKQKLKLESPGSLTLDLARAEDGKWAARWVEGSAETYEPQPIVIGESAEDFVSTDRGAVQWVAEAIRARSGADVALVPNSTVRGSLTKGPVSMSDLHDLVHRDRIALLEITGEALAALLAENQRARADMRCDVAGFTATFRADTGELGVSSLKPQRPYRVAMPSYMAGRGERFFGAALPGFESGGHVHTALIEHLTETKRIERPEPNLRVVGPGEK